MDPADPLLPKILVLVILILINAFFAAAEIAVISLSETKLRKQAEEGDKKAKKLLVLMQAPDSFLSAIQIAITLAGFLSSAFAADSFSDPLVHWLTVDKGFTAIPTSTLNTIMVVLITIVLSYFSLVLGELVPKRIAMKKTEAVARFTVGAVTSVATVFRPVIWLLSKSTNGVLRLLHIDPKADEEDVSEDEIRMMVDLGEERGAIESNEKELIDNIFEFNNTTAEDEESDTLGGLVFAQLSFIPEDGSQFTVDACGLHIEVQSFNERRVEWALVSRLPEEETPEEQEK